jgi:DNA polymerase-3 subunit gamma/tau
MPTPGDLVRRLTSEAASGGNGAPVPSGGGGGGGGARAVAGGGVVAHGEVAAAGPALPKNFREVVALVAERREALLHAQLLHHVHLVRFAPPVIELRPDASAPRDMAPKLARLLQDEPGQRWTIALSAAQGEPTLAEQGLAADTARRADAAEHPLVRTIMEMFPGARIDAVHDAGTDAYGLPLDVPAEIPLGEPEMPDFAPPDADFADDEMMEPD